MISINNFDFSEGINRKSGNFYLTKNFRELIEFFNELEEKLSYPNCEGNIDKQRVLLKAEADLILWGKI